MTAPHLSNLERSVALPQLRLNLGCCDRRIGESYLGVDIVPGAAVDEVADLRLRWPWEDGTVGRVLAHDIIEHLPDKIHTMNELHRVLAVGAEAEIIVPTTDGPAAFQDPTHVSFWNRHSFWYYERGNPYRTRFAKGYGITAEFRVCAESVQVTVDGPKLAILLVKV